MKILYLHGLGSQPGGVKASYLRQQGYEVVEPTLPPHSFKESVAIAQRAFDTLQPDVVVGSSRGGAVAMNLDAGTLPLVLIAPAWNWQPGADTVKKTTIILHSKRDEVVPFEHTRQLARRSRLPKANLVCVGDDHRMGNPAALDALRQSVEKAAGDTQAAQS